MKRFINITIISAIALTLICACGDGIDSEDTPTPDPEPTTPTAATFPRPQWIVDLQGDDQPPTYTAPDPHAYDGSMVAYVELPVDFATTAADGRKDILAAFCGDECRALTYIEPHTLQVPILIMGRENEASPITFRYYSQAHHILLTATDALTFELDGNHGVLAPTFTTPKYPVVVTATFRVTLSDTTAPSAETVYQASDDLISVHIAGHCRAVQSGNPDGVYTMTIYGSAVGESMTIEYYHAGTSHKFTSTMPLSDVDDELSVTLDIVKSSR